MREIKFRAWDVKNKIWVSPLSIGINLFGEVIAPEETYLKHNPADLILMQFTGRLDKNGVKIFEDDVLLLKDGRHGEVRLGYDGVKVNMRRPMDKIGSEKFTAIGKLMASSSEVIGNIYQHPELLTKTL